LLSRERKEARRPFMGLARIRDLQARIASEGLGGLLLINSRNILYYTGTAQPGYLLVWPEDYTLYVKSGLEFALRESFLGAEKVREERRLEDIYRKSSSRFGRNPIGTEMDILPANDFMRLQETFSGFEFVDVSGLVLEQRKRKDPTEIEKIREACQAVDMGHRAVLSTLREGITELELAAAVENAHRLAGHEGIFFMRKPDFFMSRGPIASGPNLLEISGVVLSMTGVGLSPAVPAGPSRRRIAKGDLVAVDIPTLVKGYHADQTRTYILGPPTPETLDLYAALKGIADNLVAHIKPGISCSEVYAHAVARGEALGVGDAFMHLGGGRKSQIIGHGVGLDLNEPPLLSPHDSTRIVEGCVITLELHVMRKSIGLLKLEDMVHVRRAGNEILTVSPRELCQVGKDKNGETRP
jgi:Xaa-Pro aminopeptidase